MAGSTLRAPLRRGLIVSCQAYAGEPFFGPPHMVEMARAAILGGAVGLRLNGPADIAAVRAVTDLPIIGLYKIPQPGSDVHITPDCAAARAIAAAGCDLVAVDATPRPRPGGVCAGPGGRPLLGAGRGGAGLRPGRVRGRGRQRHYAPVGDHAALCPGCARGGAAGGPPGVRVSLLFSTNWSSRLYQTGGR